MADYRPNQMNSRRLLALLLAALVAGSLAWRPIPAQVFLEEYFPETGHRVTGEFLLAYRRASNPLRIYGYPITAAFLDPQSGRQVQYFQKARFELYPDKPIGQQVQPAPLGQYLYLKGDPYPVAPNSSPCRFFPETGFQVCFAFLAFYDANGGMRQFGLPVSNLEVHNQRRVQYFQFARLEWRPGYPAGQEVIVSDLGYEYFYRQKENLALLAPEQDSRTAASILSLRVRAFPHQAVTTLSGSQTIFVVVQDQRGLPVSGARITVTLRLPSGEEQRFIIPALTDAKGISRFSFPFAVQQVGIAEVLVAVRFENLQATTLTSFRIWR